MKRRYNPHRSLLLAPLLVLSACGQENNPATPPIDSASSAAVNPSTTEVFAETTVAEPSHSAAVASAHSSQASAPSLDERSSQATDTVSTQPTSGTTSGTQSTETTERPESNPTAASSDSDSGTSATPDTTTTASSSASTSEDAGAAPALQPPADPISFGTTLDAASVMTAARDLAQTLVDPSSTQWRAKGDQHRTYPFAETNGEEPYRLYVPNSWDGASKLPLVMFLHGAGNNESSYVDQNNQQMIHLAEEHGVILVAPLGADGAYGNFLRLSAPFGNPQAASELMAAVTPESRRTNEISEVDVINVIELVLAEYPIDHSAMYLTGHSMGSGGTWYIGGKYSTYWRAIAPMSGPFVQEERYPWDNLLSIGIFVTEGTQTPSVDASRLLSAWLAEREFDSQYEEVDADHGGMVPLVLPHVFEFFADRRGP